MAWTTPKTWTAEPLTSSDLNQEVRDNITALASLPSGSYGHTSNYTTTSTSFTNIDGTNMSFSLVLEKTSDVLLGFSGSFTVSSASTCSVGFTQDASLIARTDVYVSSNKIAIPLVHLITDLAAGTYVFNAQYLTGAGTLTLYANTSQFFARSF